MHPSAQKQIVEYLALFEGGGKKKPITWMYPDNRGLITTGVGLLIDPVELAKSKVTFYQKDDEGKAGDNAAGDAAVDAEFKKVKGYTEPDANAKIPGQLRPKPGFADYHAFEGITNLRIREGASTSSSASSVAAIDRKLAKDFGGDYTTWPADVQVACIQMAYAGGFESRKKQGLAKCLRERDWYGARPFAYLSNDQHGRDAYATYNRALPALFMNGWIVDSCRKITMNNSTGPTDHTNFFGVRNALSVARWNHDSQDPEVRPDDIITGGDIWSWCQAAQIALVARK